MLALPRSGTGKGQPGDAQQQRKDSERLRKAFPRSPTAAFRVVPRCVRTGSLAPVCGANGPVCVPGCHSLAPTQEPGPEQNRQWRLVHSRHELSSNQLALRLRPVLAQECFQCLPHELRLSGALLFIFCPLTNCLPSGCSKSAPWTAQPWDCLFFLTGLAGFFLLCLCSVRDNYLKMSVLGLMMNNKSPESVRKRVCLSVRPAVPGRTARPGKRQLPAVSPRKGGYQTAGASACSVTDPAPSLPFPRQ